ncbi:MAG: hypothetical protein U9R50_11960, partial [Campylobacterota bacterium]|nr:hypothetical protein [Campylobacterota bacterium]
MRVLLFNDNPVVTKLVTLSAQKTGDELEVCSELETLKSNEYDLLIVDDALYNDDNATVLATSITVRQKLFMANRGTKEPEDFEHIINKPFLPTDLVELFASISASLEASNIEEIDDEPDMIISMEDESLDIEDDLESELLLEEDDSEMDLDLSEDLDAHIDGLDIEDIEANDDEDDMLLDLDLEDPNEADVAESVLDKDDLAEVQGLLEDTESEDIEEISDDEDELDLDSNEALSEDDALDLDLDDDLLDEDSQEIAPESIDDEVSDIKVEESLEDDALDELEDEIENAVLELSDEELEESIDEETLLDIVSNDEALESFTGLDDLDEQSLKV